MQYNGILINVTNNLPENVPQSGVLHNRIEWERCIKAQSKNHTKGGITCIVQDSKA